MVSVIGHLRRRRVAGEWLWQLISDRDGEVFEFEDNLAEQWTVNRLAPILPTTPGSTAQHYVWGAGDVIAHLDERGMWVDRYKSYRPEHYWPNKILHDAGAK